MHGMNFQRPELDHIIWNHLPRSFDLQHPVETILRAQRNDGVRLSFRDTIAVFDIRKADVQENALILDARRGYIKTTQRSSWLIKRLSDRLIFEYWRVLSIITATLGIPPRRLPIIDGELVLMPLGAASRESTHWIAPHLLSDVVRHGKQTQLIFLNEIRVLVPRGYRSLTTQLQQVRMIQQQLHTMTQLDPDDPPVDGQTGTNVALAPPYQAQIAGNFGTFLLDQFGIVCPSEDLKFYQRKFFGKL